MKTRKHLIGLIERLESTQFVWKKYLLLEMFFKYEESGEKYWKGNIYLLILWDR